MIRCKVVLLLLLVGSVHSRIDYFAQFEAINLVERLRLLVPEALLRKYEFVKEDGLGNRSACERDVALYQTAIDKRESWALRMLDSSSRLPTGILQGNIIDLGMFDECVSVKTGEIEGRHCMYAISPGVANFTFPVSPQLSICLPASCTDGDVVKLLNDVIKRNDELREHEFAITWATCTHEKELNSWGIVFLIVTSVYISLLIVCTYFDVCERIHGPRERPIIPEKILDVTKRFSMLKSAENILNTEGQKNELAFMHGIRVIASTWVVFVHEYLLRLFGPIHDVVNVSKCYSSRKSIIALVAVQNVDTFLAMNGFLIAYLVFNEIKKTNKFINVPVYYIYRYFRLTLPVAAFIFGSMALVPLISSGAQFDRIINMFVTDCTSKWWYILLYIRNFIEFDNVCFMHLWTLSVDMQLYWISPLILYPLYKKPKIGLIILGLLLLGSILSMTTLIGINKYSALYITLNPSVPHLAKAFHDVYIQTHTRATPWFIGVYFGYKVAYQNVKPTKNVIYTGWILTSLAFTFCIYGVRCLTLATYEYNVYWEILYASLSKVFWAFGVCWIIYACINDAGGPVATILSWKYFRPLSKLSYCIYLVHMTFPTLQVAMARTPLQWNELSIFYTFVTNMVLSVVMAFIFCIIFETPMLVISSLLFKKKTELQNEVEIKEKSNHPTETEKTK